MSETVKAYLESKRYMEKKSIEEEKEKTLIELGLYEKVYSPDNKYSDEYKESEWDSVNGGNRYYKMVPCEITDEEYCEIKKYEHKKEVARKNGVAMLLRVIAWLVFIGGFVAGIALGNVEVEKGYYYSYTDTEFSFVLAAAYWGVFLASGSIFLGLAEIIELLQKIKDK